VVYIYATMMHRVAKDDLPALYFLARRQVIWGYAFASSSYARAVQDVIWNSSSGLEVCECVDPRVLFRWEKKLIHVRRPEIVSDKQGMGIFFDVKVCEYSRPLHIVRLDRCKSLYKKKCSRALW
jgi:hypothetical protein